MTNSKFNALLSWTSLIKILVFVKTKFISLAFNVRVFSFYSLLDMLSKHTSTEFKLAAEPAVTR